MTDKELAKRIREVLEKHGWQPAPGLSYAQPVCLMQAAGEALRDEYPIYSNLAGRRERINEFAQALGFENRRAAIHWNDAQTDVEAIFERLEQVT